MLNSSKRLRDEAKLVKSQNVNKDRGTEQQFGGTGLRRDGTVHDRTKLDHSKDCSKKLRKWRDQKDSEYRTYTLPPDT